MLQTPALIMACYASLSLILPLKIRLFYKILGVGIIFLCALKYHFYARMGGILSPDLPSWLIVIMEAAFGSLIIGSFICLIKDLLFVLLFILRKCSLIKLKLNLFRLNVCVIIFALIFGFYGTCMQFFTPHINHETIEIKNLDKDFDGFKIAQLSDLHVGPLLKHEFMQKVVAAVNNEEVDLTVITGDLVDGRVEKLINEFRSLKDIKSPHGVLAVTGNHEYYSGSYAWIKALENFNVRFLQNEHVNLHKGNGTLTVGGINDGRSYGNELDKVFADAGKHTRVFLAHKPKDGVKAVDADLILTGHTHGGTMLFARSLVADYNDGFVSGRYELENRVMYVSNGTGIWSGFSCRFLVPPEITIFTLKKLKS